MCQSLMDEDFGRLGGDLQIIAAALALFAKSLSPGGEYEKEGARWIYRPNDFVTFQVQPKKRAILLSLRGHRMAFKEKAENCGFERAWREDLDRGWSLSYSEYQITNANQLAAAAQFVKWASEHPWHRRARSAGRRSP